MSECCLLLICCDPLVRRAKAVEHYTDLGYDARESARLADDLLTIVDAMLALTPVKIAEMVRQHGK